MAKWHFYIETYGCKVNQYESEKLREAWERHGGEECNSPTDAHYILINSCAITSRAERDARNAVYRLKKAAPQATVILCGCAAQFFSEFTPRRNHHYITPDICIPQSQKELLLAGPLLNSDGYTPMGGISGFSRARPIVKIQDGCSQNCSYCIVPQTRGKPVSRSPQEILAECETLCQNGFTELMLSGVNLRQYWFAGFGNFWTLLQFLDANLARRWNDVVRLRISSLEPGQLTDKALEILANTRLLCPHIHLSIQHASPAILKNMGRSHYHAQKILDWLDKLGNVWPIMGIGCDLIAGFPGETPADLQILYEFIQASPLTYAHVFSFSARQGTKAQNMPNQIAKKEKLARAGQIRAWIADKKTKFLQKQLGLEQMTIICDRNLKDGQSKGINEYYTTCIIENLSDGPTNQFITVKPKSIVGDKMLVVKR